MLVLAAQGHPPCSPLPSSAPAACRPLPVLDLCARAGFGPRRSSGSSRDPAVLPDSPSPPSHHRSSLPRSPAVCVEGCQPSLRTALCSRPTRVLYPYSGAGLCPQCPAGGGDQGRRGVWGRERWPTSHSTCAKLAPRSRDPPFEGSRFAPALAQTASTCVASALSPAAGTGPAARGRQAGPNRPRTRGSALRRVRARGPAARARRSARAVSGPTRKPRPPPQAYAAPVSPRLSSLCPRPRSGSGNQHTHRRGDPMSALGAADASVSDAPVSSAALGWPLQSD